MQTLDAGWDVAAVGEGESTLIKLVDAGGAFDGIPGLAYLPRRAAAAGHVPGFSLRWNGFSALEITRGCTLACQYKRQLPSLVT